MVAHLPVKVQVLVRAYTILVLCPPSSLPLLPPSSLHPMRFLEQARMLPEYLCMCSLNSFQS